MARTSGGSAMSPHGSVPLDITASHEHSDFVVSLCSWKSINTDRGVEDGRTKGS